MANHPVQNKRPYLPALVCSAIVGVVFGDVGVDATESQLFVRSRRDGLDDQLCIGIRWLGLILDKRDPGINIHTFSYTYCTRLIFSLGQLTSFDVAGSSPWGCLHQPTPPAAHFPHPSALQCFFSAQKRPWQQIQLLTGGQR